MIDLSQIPIKLGEPKRLAALGFGIGALFVSTATVAHQGTSLVFLGLGIVALSMTIAGYLNPVTVSPGPAPSQYNAIPASFGTWNSTNTRAVSTPYQPIPFRAAFAAGSASDVGLGKVTNTFQNAYGAGAGIIPAGPATLALQEVRFAAEPMYLRYVTGTENEGKIVGQGG
jgi:hypothetical protein